MTRVSSLEDMNVPGISSRPLKRRSTDTSVLPFFTPSSETFNPQPYAPAGSQGSRRVSKAAEIVNHALKPMDPIPGDGISSFIRLPFLDFPNAHLYPEGLTFTWLAENPEWFLDPRDFKGENDDEVPNAITYPTSLEPPRGWCPAKKKDSRSSSDDSDEAPALRCTFCRRKYAGVNAKSMWRRHVLEKHKIPMSNRREGPVESTRSNRSNKENRGIRRPIAGSSLPRSVSCGSLPPRQSSMRSDSRTLLPAFEHPSHFSSQANIGAHATISLGDYEGFESPPIAASSKLPELSEPALLSPPIVPSQEPVNPPQLTSTTTKTPPKRERRIKSRLPWKFPDPKHPLYNSPDDLVLGVPIEGIKGDGLQTGYVPAQSSPFNFSSFASRSPKLPTSPPASSSPLSAKMLTGRVLGWKRSSSDGAWTTLPGLPSPEPRSVLKYSGPLPVPVNDRLEVDNSNLSMSTDGFTSDEIDTSLATLDDSFPSWFDIDGVAQQSPSKVFLGGASGLTFQDTPIKHSGGQVLTDLFDMSSAIDNTSSWLPQPSGLGLGILLPSYAKGNSDQVTQIAAALQMQGSEGGFSGNWDFGGELGYPEEEELEGPENSPDDEDVFNVGDNYAPPMKRRKTVC